MKIGEQDWSLLKDAPTVIPVCTEDHTLSGARITESHWRLPELCFPRCHSRGLKEGIIFSFEDYILPPLKEGGEKICGVVSTLCSLPFCHQQSMFA